MPPLGADEEEAGMIPRSLLFAPGDSDRKMEKASGCGADLVILDLEDSVAPGMKLIARKNTIMALNDINGEPRRWRCVSTAWILNGQSETLPRSSVVLLD